MLARSPRFALLLGSCLGLCLFKFTCKLIWKWVLEDVPVQMIAKGQGVYIGGCFEVVLPKEFDSKCFESFHFILCLFVSISLSNISNSWRLSFFFILQASYISCKALQWCWQEMLLLSLSRHFCVHWWVSGLLHIVYYMNSSRVIRLWFERCSL